MNPADVERSAAAHDRTARAEDKAGHIYPSGYESGTAKGMRDAAAGLLAPCRHEHYYWSCVWTEAVFVLGVLLAGGGTFLLGLAMYILCA